MENSMPLLQRVTTLEERSGQMRDDLYGRGGDDIGLVREFRKQQDMRAGESRAVRRMVAIFGIINTMLLIIIALRQLKMM